MEKKDKKDKFIKSFRFPRLSEEQCRKLHGASLEILERVGVRLLEEESILLLRKAGANPAEHKPEPLPTKVKEKLRKVVCNAKKGLK